LSHCAVGKFDPNTDALIAVTCPSRFCMTWVRLVDGRISEHDGMFPGRCQWIGTRVVDDRADFPPEQITVINGHVRL
jgi:hypothetical protein